jgi:hypothetical protein
VGRWWTTLLQLIATADDLCHACVENIGTAGDFGVNALVEHMNASGIGAHAAPVPGFMPIKKIDGDEQIVFGEVYAPGFPDSQRDFASAETIKEMAYDFMRRGLLSKIDVGHSERESGSYVVESFIARPTDPDFIPGSWVLGVKIPDARLWKMVKSGELNGFSMGGVGERVKTQLVFEMPEQLEGRTDDCSGHSHGFVVRYDEAGNFLGGHTRPGPDGHVHRIIAGTVTEIAAGHSHRFSYVEGVLGVIDH